MKAEERFNKVVERYNAAFEKNNGFKPHRIWFYKGWVYFRIKESSISDRVRAAKFEVMTETLEKRLL